MTVVGAAVNILLNVSFLFAFYRHRSSSDIRYWSVGLFLNFVGAALLALRGQLPDVLSSLLGGTVYISNIGFMLLGFQCFFGRKRNFTFVLVPPVLFFATVFPFLGTPKGLALGSLEIFVTFSIVSFMISRELFAHRRIEPLPSLGLAGFIYLTYALAQLVSVVLAILYPLHGDGAGNIQSQWFGWFMLEIVLHKTICAVVILVLVNDRVEMKLRTLASTDVLTGIANRRAFMDHASQIYGQQMGDVAIAIFDLDGFKKINDTYGHLAGDAVLRAFCDVVREHIEPGMIFGRMGGEEFALCLRVREPAETISGLNRIREKVACTPVFFSGSEISMKVSIGVAFSDQTGFALDPAMAAADFALYMSKRNGRNQVCRCDPADRLKNIVDAELSGMRAMPRLAHGA